MEECCRYHSETARNPQRPPALTHTACGRVPRREPSTEGRLTAVGSAGFAGANLTAPGRPFRRHRRDCKLTGYPLVCLPPERPSRLLEFLQRSGGKSFFRRWDDEEGTLSAQSGLRCAHFALRRSPRRGRRRGPERPRNI